MSHVSMVGNDRGPLQCPSAPDRHRARAAGSGMTQPLESFAHIPSVAPETTECARQPFLPLGAVWVRLAPLQRRTEVVVLGLQPFDPLNLIWSDQSDGPLLSQRDIEIAMHVPQ